MTSLSKHSYTIRLAKQKANVLLLSQVLGRDLNRGRNKGFDTTSGRGNSEKSDGFETFGMNDTNNQVRYSAMDGSTNGSGNENGNSSSGKNNEYGDNNGTGSSNINSGLTPAQLHEQLRLRSLLCIQQEHFVDMHKFETGEEHRVNDILGSASTELCQVFRHYAAMSQNTTGAAKIARKDFVKMAKDSHLIDVSSKNAKVINSSSAEALAAMKIQATQRGRKDRQKVALMKSKSLAKIQEEQNLTTPSSPSSTSVSKTEKKQKSKLNKSYKSTDKKKRRSSLRSQMLSTKHYGRKHAERAFDAVAQQEVALDLTQFAEAIIRLGVLRFATSNELSERHTLDVSKKGKHCSPGSVILVIGITIFFFQLIIFDIASPLF